jgi:hypothetical protein
MHLNEMSFWIPLRLEMKLGVFTSHLNQNNGPCNGAMGIQRLKGRQQTSVTWGYKGWFQDSINVWTMPATVQKNKVT